MSDGSILLTAIQSCTIHGWLTPKRTLTWKDVCANKRITPSLCHQCKIDGDMLCMIQPSLQSWIDVCDVSFSDVEYMIRWPLHPFRDLHGHIPDLITNGYKASLLRKLGITYQVLVLRNMTVEWMKMFKFTGQEWGLLGLDASFMTDRDISFVFGVDRATLQMLLSSY
jgi:hypothetical protein